MFVSKLHCSQAVDDEVDTGIFIPECTDSKLFANAKCPQKNVRKYVARNIFASLLRMKSVLVQPIRDYLMNIIKTIEFKLIKDS